MFLPLTRLDRVEFLGVMEVKRPRDRVSEIGTIGARMGSDRWRDLRLDAVVGFGVVVVDDVVRSLASDSRPDLDPLEEGDRPVSDPAALDLSPVRWMYVGGKVTGLRLGVFRMNDGNVGFTLVVYLTGGRRDRDRDLEWNRFVNRSSWKFAFFGSFVVFFSSSSSPFNSLLSPSLFLSSLLSPSLFLSSLLSSFFNFSSFSSTSSINDSILETVVLDGTINLLLPLLLSPPSDGDDEDKDEDDEDDSPSDWLMLMANKVKMRNKILDIFEAKIFGKIKGLKI